MEMEGFITEEPSSQPRWGKRMGLMVGAAGLVALAGTMSAVKLSNNWHVRGVQIKEERLEIIPSYAACSKGTEDCSSTGCCKTSGHRCFSKANGKAQCNMTCTAGVQGFTCDTLKEATVPVERELGQNLYCWSVYTKETGSTKENTELKLLALQKQYGISIFACEQWDVFSDVDVQVGDSELRTIKVEDEFGEFTKMKREGGDDGDAGYVNWGLFYQVWVKLREVGKWEAADYTVKVDPDAVFVPQRLRDYLASRVTGESSHGMYLENCKKVQYGFFGHIEVITREATRVMTKYLEDCHAVFAPCAFDGCDWEYGPWGEDVFVQRCLDHHYVDKMEAFDMTNDGACQADRPEGQEKNKKWHSEDCSQLNTATAHPFKKPDEYAKCMGEMMGQTFTA